MAVDVVGYSRLMGEDEAGTARRCAKVPRRRVPGTIDAALANGSYPPVPVIQIDNNCGEAVVPERRFVGRQDVRSAPSHSSLPIMRELANGFGRDECG